MRKAASLAHLCTAIPVSAVESNAIPAKDVTQHGHALHDCFIALNHGLMIMAVLFHEMIA